jgi:lysophospholipase L1-like esterase
VGGIVFVGSSSIRLWKTLAQDFPGYPVLNRGFGGSQIIDSLYFADRIILPYRPRLVVLYAGANDLNAGKTADQVFGDFSALAAKIHAALPQTRIAFISIAGNPARWAQVDRVREANRRIQRYCATDPRLAFIDVFSHMLGPDGLPKPEIFADDRLHMNEKGYTIWKELVKPHLLISQTGQAE